MKKITVNFENINNELLKEIAKAYPNGFIESDVISFSDVDPKMEDRVKVVLENSMYLIKKSTLEDSESSNFDNEYFESFTKEKDKGCDAEYCEED
ncbi:hypothetical protein [Aquimarina latercula]|uniref:hypothetical protein n=1 Tax=Aquimarina latercula TaxID=987 RepID=UPI0003FBE3E6|nr:hypothetical protein [Aquimarina latercula]